MSLVPNDVITEAKVVVHDDVSPTWTDAKYVAAFNEALRAIAAKYPTAFVDATTYRLLTPNDIAVELADIGAEVAVLDERFGPPIVSYIAYRFFSSDAADVRNRRLASAHYGEFLTSLSAFLMLRR